MWSLQYAGTVYEFGRVSVTSVEIGGRSYRVADTPNPRSDGVMFGQDFADPGDVKLELLLNFQHVRNLDMQRAMLTEAANEFLTVWDAAKMRRYPWGIAEFIIPLVGMLEGRPRRAEWDWSTFGLGYLIGAATFIRASNEIYPLDAGGNSVWREATVSIAPPTETSGWVFPLVFPLQNLDPVAGSAIWFEVGGAADAWPVIEVSGPIQAGAEVEVAGEWVLRLNRDLAYDEVALVDSRPGRRVCTVNGVPANVLAPSSAKLSGLSVSPGPHQVSLRGVSPQGTAFARIRWRDTKAGI